MLISPLSILVLRSKNLLDLANKKGRLRNTNGIASVINPILSTALGAVLPEGMEQSAPVGVLREFQKIPWLFHRD
jgi:hypothetical protein